MVLKRSAPKELPPATRLVGYARVSTEDQKLDLQVDALRRAGVLDDNLHIEKKSAASKSRPALEHALKDLREGDTLVVWRLDRLARNMRELYARLDQIAEAGASFKSLTEQFDFSTATGKLILGLFAIVAEFERQLTIERTKAGIEAFKEREGGWKGAPKKVTDKTLQQIKALRKQGLTVKQIAAKLKISEGIIYLRLRECRERKKSK
jgi:DNA invertase Pin-like site-specific DNA recombinase